MKLLFVQGDDFSAMTFEGNFMPDTTQGLLDLWNEARELDDWTVYFDNDEIEVTAYEFVGKIDPEFLSFFEDNFMDYDQSKATNYYIVEN